MSNYYIGAIRKQKHRCPFCGNTLLHNGDLYAIFKDGNKHNRKDENLVIVHQNCYNDTYLESIQMPDAIPVNLTVPVTRD